MAEECNKTCTVVYIKAHKSKSLCITVILFNRLCWLYTANLLKMNEIQHDIITNRMKGEFMVLAAGLSCTEVSERAL